jgi:hypothetical protein
MARKASTPGEGHNSKTPLTDDEAAALTVYYELKIIEAQRKVDALMVDMKSARDVVNGHFKRMTADLGFTRKDFEAEVIALGQMTEAEYINHEKRRARLHRLAGRAVGEQLDLIEAIDDTVNEALQAEHDGYRAGRRADDPVPPSTLSTIFHQDWLRGWHSGQEFNGAQLIKAHEIIARPKPGVMVAADDGASKPLPEPGTPEHDAALRESERLARESLGMEPTAAEQDFEEADNGRTIRAIDEAA